MRTVRAIVGFLMFAPLLVGAVELDNWIQVQGGTWTVSRSEVSQMAGLLKSAAAAARAGKKTARNVSTYVIQFKGIGSAGQRAVELRGFCESGDHSMAELRKAFRNALDGGDCHFGARWDATEKRFKQFLFNGVA